MPDYSKGKIYMLEPTIEYNKGDIYYGSTIQPLHKRLYEHKKSFKRNEPINSKLLFEKYGIENVKIILIKQHPCNSKKELEAEEATYIRNNTCVNRNIPCRSPKEYREANKEKLQEYFKNYNTINSDKKKEYLKIYNESNKEKLQEKKKEYRAKNKSMINAKVKCECGCLIVKRNLRQHRGFKRHSELLKNLELLVHK